MGKSIGRTLRSAIALAAATALTVGPPAAGQAPAPTQAEGPPRFPMRMEPDPRVQQRTYHFADTNEDLAYTVFVSSRVKPDKPAPLIVALHGYGGDSNFIVRGKLIDLAEENGYIVVGPMGYNATGWYGSPVIIIGNGPIEPANLTELSEKDVMNVLDIVRREFNVDPDRTYLMGHSMGGAGALFLGQKHPSEWAALASIAPAAFMMQPNQKTILEPIKAAGLPLMITQGDNDPVVPATNTRTWAVAMEELGMKHEYIEMPGDHGTIIADGMPDIFRFFGAHARGK